MMMECFLFKAGYDIIHCTCWWLVRLDTSQSLCHNLCSEVHNVQYSQQESYNVYPTAGSMHALILAHKFTDTKYPSYIQLPLLGSREDKPLNLWISD